MTNVHLSAHPLVGHKLARLRHRDAEPKLFRELVAEIARLLFYEATRDLNTDAVTVPTRRAGAANVPPGGAHLPGGARQPFERGRLHRAGVRRRGRPAIRHGVRSRRPAQLGGSADSGSFFGGGSGTGRLTSGASFRLASN